MGPSPVLTRSLPRSPTVAVMTRLHLLHGNVAQMLEPPVEYELRDVDPPTSARVTAELAAGRFTIATDKPHVKVAWRVTGLLPQSRPEEE